MGAGAALGQVPVCELILSWAPASPRGRCSCSHLYCEEADSDAGKRAWGVARSGFKARPGCRFGFIAGPSPWVSHSAPCQSKLRLNHCLVSTHRLQALKQVEQWKK